MGGKSKSKSGGVQADTSKQMAANEKHKVSNDSMMGLLEQLQGSQLGAIAPMFGQMLQGGLGMFNQNPNMPQQMDLSQFNNMFQQPPGTGGPMPQPPGMGGPMPQPPADQQPMPTPPNWQGGHVPLPQFPQQPEPQGPPMEVTPAPHIGSKVGQMSEEEMERVRRSLRGFGGVK